MNALSDEGYEILNETSASQFLLANMCRKAGISSAHRGLSSGMLIRLLEGSMAEEEIYNPVDDLRKSVMDFIKTHADHLKISCDGNCFAHTDVKVIQCYLRLQDGNTL